MKLRKQFWLKIAAGIILWLVAAGAAVAIHDALAMQNPKNSLPDMSVWYNGTDEGVRLPAENVKLDSYSWSYLYGATPGGGKVPEIWREIPPAWVPPHASLSLEFSFKPDWVKVSRAAGEGEFVELDGDLTSPGTPGRYTYKVEGSWGTDRSVIYYFRIEIPEW